MQPLLKWGVLASKLHNFLGNNATEEGSHRRDASTRIESGIEDHFLIHLINKETLGILVRCIDSLSISENSLEVLISVSGKAASILLLELPDTTEGDMKLL